MTNKERKDIVDKKYEERLKREHEQRAIEERKTLDAVIALNELNGRIADLIEMANYVVARGFKLPGLSRYGYEYGSYADYSSSYPGLIRKSGREDEVAGFGFTHTGQNGKWYVLATGLNCWMYNYDTGEKEPVPRYYLSELARYFPDLEKAFYRWIDEGMK